jgi:multidrug efflux pump subunit AcrA (membrane-fusion protein)
MIRQQSHPRRTPFGTRFSQVPHWVAFSALPLVLALVVVGCGGDSKKGDWGDWKKKNKDFKIPVRVATPKRDTVEDWVETQANLESDRRAMILAEVDGRIIAQFRDLGDRVGEGGVSEGGSGGDHSGDRADPFLLARIDDRDLKLGLKEAEIKVREVEGRLEELKVDQSRAERQLEQAVLEAEQAAATLKRMTSGIKDGAITAEEHETSVFAEKVGRAKVAADDAALDKAKVAVTLGAVLLEDARVKLERSQVSLERTQLRAPFDGVVSYSNVHIGQRVRVGDHLYTVEDPSHLIVYGEVPVRQANRVAPGNTVWILSSATEEPTTARVVRVAPTVDSESGTVRVKVAVDAKSGFRPGLFVDIRITVESRENALVIPKRAVLQDDETGPYVFVIREEKANRLDIKTGYETAEFVEVIEGLAAADSVVIEGQDTLTDEATVRIIGDE